MLDGKRILITRPRRGAERMAAALRARGAVPIVAPTIEIGPPDDGEPAVRALREIGEYSWIVFTSRAGVDACFTNLKRIGDIRTLAHLKFAAVGPRTADSLANYGVRADLISGRFTTDDAARELLERTHQGERVLIYAAQDNRDIIRSVLAAEGRLPSVVAAYATHFLRDPELPERARAADVITFTSGSTVRGFVAAFADHAAAAGAANDKTVACIGPITADEAAQVGIRVDVVPHEFTTEALITALEDYFVSCG